jgi:hypothetical protein
MWTDIFSLRLVALILTVLLIPTIVLSAQEVPIPEECEALKVWESTREQRIEQEFQRRGISNPVDKEMRRTEVERVIDERIQTLRELCAEKKL